MRVPVDAIIIGAGHRRTTKKAVTDLVISIQAIGMQTPITVLPAGGDGRYPLVAGRHRLAAHRALGLTEIEVRVIEDRLAAQLWHLAENLHRADLSALERNLALGKWIALAGKKLKRDGIIEDPVSSVGTKPNPGRPESGISLAARQLGIAKTTAHRAVRISARLTKAAQKVAKELGLDTDRKALERASGVPGSHQITVLRDYAERQQKLAAERERIKAIHEGTAPPRSPAEAFNRWFWALEPDMQDQVRRWLLGGDLERWFDEYDRMVRLLDEDRRALH